MSSKVVKSVNYDNLGFNSVTIQNKYGQFTGYAWCCDEDMANGKYSMYVGQRYAETRARQAFAKFRWKQEKVKLKTMQNLYKDLLNDPKCADDKSLRYVQIKVRDYTESVENWGNLYHYYKRSIKEQEEMREKILNRAKEEKDS